MGLKDQFNPAGNAKTVTLSPQDIQLLAHINKYAQQMLDQLQEHLAATFLNHLCVTRFDYRPGSDLRFNFQPQKSVDNLTITEITEA